MSQIFNFSARPDHNNPPMALTPCSKQAAAGKPQGKPAKALHPTLEPIAEQIRNYYTTLHTDYVALQRQAALARVQQALEPLTVALIS